MDRQVRTMKTTVRSDAISSRPALQAAIVVGWALLTGLSAAIKFPLPFTPVPMTLQTGVVLLGAAWFGRLGVLAQVLYVLLGGLGLPFFAVQAPGLSPLWGATGGYLVGFIFTAKLTERFVFAKSMTFAARWLRLAAISLAYFVPGVWVLMLSSGVDFTRAVELGFLPFVLGDALKIAVVSMLSKFGTPRT